MRLENDEKILIKGEFEKKLGLNSKSIIFLVIFFTFLTYCCSHFAGIFVTVIDIIVFAIWYNFYKKNIIELYCTNKKIYLKTIDSFTHSETEKEAYLDTISDIIVKKDEQYGNTLVIKSAGNTIIEVDTSYGWIMNAEKIKSIAMQQKEQSIKLNKKETLQTNFKEFNSNNNVKEKLKELKTLFDDGLITEKEYNDKRQEYLNLL